MPAKSEPTPRTAEPSSKYRVEKKSMKCPVCFGNKTTNCSHGMTIKSKTGNQKPFIGCYNKIVYQDIKIPANEKEEYENYIFNCISIFSNQLTDGEKTDSTYRDLLMTHFYEPLMWHVKKRGYVAKDTPLSIKQEHKTLPTINCKNTMCTMSDDDSVDLGACSDDDHQTRKYYSSANQKMESNNPVPKKNEKIKKATPKKVVTKENLDSSATQQVFVKNRTTRCSNSMLLSERDFQDLSCLQKALRRELNQPCTFQFEKLQYKHPEIGRRASVKECDVVVLRKIVKEKKLNIMELRFGRKIEKCRKSSKTPPIIAQ